MAGNAGIEGFVAIEGIEAVGETGKTERAVEYNGLGAGIGGRETEHAAKMAMLVGMDFAPGFAVATSATSAAQACPSAVAPNVVFPSVVGAASVAPSVAAPVAVAAAAVAAALDAVAVAVARGVSAVPTFVAQAVFVAPAFAVAPSAAAVAVLAVVVAAVAAGAPSAVPFAAAAEVVLDDDAAAGTAAVVFAATAGGFAEEIEAGTAAVAAAGWSRTWKGSPWMGLRMGNLPVGAQLIGGACSAGVAEMKHWRGNGALQSVDSCQDSFQFVGASARLDYILLFEYSAKPSDPGRGPSGRETPAG